MAVRDSTRARAALDPGNLPFRLMAACAAALSLAAALLAMLAGGSATQRAVVAPQQELALRNQRIALFEARAGRDQLDFPSLNTLAGEYLARARETGDLGDYGRAETAALRSLDIAPGDNFAGLLELSLVRIAQHDFGAAEDLARQALLLKPRSAPAFGALGDALIGLGRYDEADRAYDRMLELQPDLGSLSRQAGLAFLLGDVRNGEDFWRQAVRAGDEASPENQAWALVQLGLHYFATGNLDRAGDRYEAALTRYPDYVHALAGLGAVEAARGRWQRAIDFYSRAQELLPLPQYVIALGDVYARAGRAAEAESQYQLVAVIDRLYQANGVNTDLQLALFYADHGPDTQRALELAANAYAASPNVYAADALAWALHGAGRYEEAVRYSEEALRLGTPEAGFYYHAALVRLGLGDRTAIQYLQTALRLNQHFSLLHAPAAASLLQELKGGQSR